MADLASATVVTVSTSAAAGKASDESGPVLEGLLNELGFDAVRTLTVADDRGAIKRALSAEVDAGTQLVLTTGGTGLSRDDLTPEATAEVIVREIPGLSEAIRAESIRRVPTGALTRGVSGTAGDTLIINLPGRPTAAAECFGAISPAIPHALDQIKGFGGRERH